MRQCADKALQRYHVGQAALWRSKTFKKKLNAIGNLSIISESELHDPLLEDKQGRRLRERVHDEL
jgi:hypothetical protein